MIHRHKSAAVAASFREARKYTRRYARSFYFSSHVLPKEKRDAAYAIYAFCRFADNLVDDGGADIETSLRNLRAELDALYGGTGSPVFASFAETVRRFDIPKEHFLDLFRGLEMDLSRTRYQDFAELEDYCYCVASVVGLVMARVFGADSDPALRHARDLGTAMQLTNILRDVREDAGRGRIYLPLSYLRAFGVTEEETLEGTTSARFRSLMKFQIDSARRYYRSGCQGFRHLPDDGSRYCVQLMAGTYGRILSRIEAQDYDVFARRAAVPFWEKLLIAAAPERASRFTADSHDSLFSKTMIAQTHENTRNHHNDPCS